MTHAPTFSAAALRLARLRAGLTQLEVANRCAEHDASVTQPLMSHWETGRQAPSPGVLPVLAEVLNCPVDEFFREPLTSPAAVA